MHDPLIIDIRCRIPVGTTAEYFQEKLGENAPHAVMKGTDADFFRDLDEARIRTAVSPSGNNQGMTLGHRLLPPRTTSNDEQAAIQKKHPGRFIGVAAIDTGNITHNALEELERCVRVLGLNIATIEPGRAPLYAPHPADKRLYAFYELAQELEVPVILQTSGLLGGKNIDYANPRWIDQLAEDFPGLNLICAHGCYPYVREIIAVMCRRKNVFASPDLYLFWPGSRDWIEAVNQNRIANNFLFGSAYPLCGNLKKFVDRFLMLDWNPEILDRILYKNAIRALKLEHNPDFGYQHHQSGIKLPGLPLQSKLKRFISRLHRCPGP